MSRVSNPVAVDSDSIPKRVKTSYSAIKSILASSVSKPATLLVASLIKALKELGFLDYRVGCS